MEVCQKTKMHLKVVKHQDQAVSHKHMLRTEVRMTTRLKKAEGAMKEKAVGWKL